MSFGYKVPDIEEEQDVEWLTPPHDMAIAKLSKRTIVPSEDGADLTDLMHRHANCAFRTRMINSQKSTIVLSTSIQFLGFIIDFEESTVTLPASWAYRIHQGVTFLQTTTKVQALRVNKCFSRGSPLVSLSHEAYPNGPPPPPQGVRQDLLPLQSLTWWKLERSTHWEVICPNSYVGEPI